MFFSKNKVKKKLILGIDFGTTYSLLASIQNERTILLTDNKKRFLLPSIVNFNKSKPLIGWEAEKKIVEDPINTITSVKRLIGRSIDFIKKEFPILPYVIEENKDGGVLFHTNAGLVTPIDVASEILKFLKEKACEFFNQKIDATVITVPAYFDNLQKESIKKAAISAKINLIRLLNEPTSAAVAYGLQLDKQGLVVVYDLGGGTFDVSILKLNKGIFEVLGTAGDSNLGGDDFDTCLANYIYKKLNFPNKCNIFFQSLLLKKAKEIKIKLTQYEKVEINFFNWNGVIYRDEFNLIIKNLIRKTLFICSNILKEIDLKVEHIKEVIMVGGSTRVPLVYEEVKKFFRRPPLISINPDQVVAIGAAMQSGMLVQNTFQKRTILLDVIPLSLGIEVMGGFVEKIILRNTPIPISKTKEFTTSKDNQSSILIHVLQGERELVKDCISLSRFVLKNIPSKKAGMVRILVTFEVDADGLISVQALEKASHKQKKVQIENIVFLKNKNINNIIKESTMYAKDDYYLRVKKEKKIESKYILDILNNALQEDKHLITSEELKKIRSKQIKLQKSIDDDDFFSMKLNLKKLEEVSKNFFSLRLKKTIDFSSIKN
ncbi:Fe-S protein assembly chaperone HscA [Buchnera aphidicola]|uniref:Chaperone protein HscA n=1 Tax=Buchnera aphidicola subsp. Rhopalosiphum maidis TaxID=118109 RepID=A0A3G2I512_BUCRM|nr:Fe-S protein assembly chaperone HscA [Buchnera aphidicola]AYN24502.1 Fe-S protein assembly chaperone HscA [Buchnera aphidicola (Rhopalosiphum maidis)]